MSAALVPLAEGFEEIESMTIIDILRRADVDVTVAGLKHGALKGSRGVHVVPDVTLDEALGRDYDLVALPGGLPGAQYLNDDSRVQQLVKDMAGKGKVVAAICAAPMVLANTGLLEGKKATSYPGVLDKMDLPGTTCTGGVIEEDGNIVTSRGPGTAMDFALALVERLEGPDKRKSVEDALVRP